LEGPRASPGYPERWRDYRRCSFLCSLHADYRGIGGGHGLNQAYRFSLSHRLHCLVLPFIGAGMTFDLCNFQPGQAYACSGFSIVIRIHQRPDETFYIATATSKQRENYELYGCSYAGLRSCMDDLLSAAISKLQGSDVRRDLKFHSDVLGLVLDLNWQMAVHKVTQ
jgi:hypothetical protein